MSNLVNFPENQESDDQLDELRRAQKVLKDVTDKRKKAVEKLADVVDNLDKSDKFSAEHLSPAHMELLRDVRRGLTESLTALEAHDNLLDMITNDLVGMVQNFEQHAMSTQKANVLFQSMVIALLDKGVLTNEEFKASQTKVISELQEAFKRQNGK